MSIQVTIMSIDFDSFEEPITKVFQKNEITIGRKSHNDLVLDRNEISSEHARITARVNGDGESIKLFVTDLGSSNGTMLERDSLSHNVEVPLQANQRLIIGSYLLKPSVVGGLVSAEEAEANESAAISPEPESATVSAAESADSTPEAPVAAPEASETVIGASFSDITSGSSDTTGVHAAIVPPPVLKLEVEADSILDLDFVADQLFTLSGRVTHKGDALSGVKVDGGTLGSKETGADGRFVFADVVEESDYRLHLSKDGYVLEPSILTGTLSADALLHVSATKLFQVRGKVVHKGKALAGVTVHGGNLGTTITDKDGAFHFADVRNGTSFEISAEKPRYAIESSVASGTVSGDLTVDFSARQLVKVAGRVVHKGRALVGVEIECVKLGKTVTDENGCYSFENVPEGAQYTFTAQKPGFRLSHTRELN